MKKKIKEAFTLIELVIVMIIMLTIFGYLFKTIYDVNQYNIRLANTVTNYTNQLNLQDFFTNNEIGDIVYAYIPYSNSEMYNDDYKNNNEISTLINNIINDLDIKREFVFDINGTDINVKLPILVFKDKNNRLGFIGYIPDKYNLELESLYLKLFYVNDNYYSITRGKYTLSNLLYLYKIGDNNSIKKYIDDLNNTSLDILSKVVVSESGNGLYSSINYISLDNISKSIIIFPSGNLSGTNLSVYSRSIEDLGYSKLYYGYIDIKYKRAGELFSIFSNFLIQ